MIIFVAMTLSTKTPGRIRLKSVVWEVELRIQHHVSGRSAGKAQSFGFRNTSAPKKI